MENIRFRPLCPDDYDQIVDLVMQHGNDFYDRWLGFIPSAHDIRRQVLSDRDFDEALLIGAFDGESLVGAIQGICRSWKAGREKTGYIKWMYVNESHRGQGIAKELLRICEAALSKYSVKTLVFGSCSPAYLFAGIPADDVALTALLNSSGWFKKSERVSIIADMENMGISRRDVDEILAAKPAIRLEIAREEHREALDELIFHNFSRSWSLEIEPVFDPEHPAFCSLLFVDDRLLAFAPVHNANPNWFGPMGTHPDFRGNGYGKLVFFHAMLEGYKRGVTRMFINWINGKENFYGRFVKEKEWLTFLNYEKVIG